MLYVDKASMFTRPSNSTGSPMNKPGSWCLAVGGRRGRFQGPCWVSWPWSGAPAEAEAVVAVAQGVPGRWGLAGAVHL